MRIQYNPHNIYQAIGLFPKLIYIKYIKKLNNYFYVVSLFKCFKQNI
jgi:hypothetical protein